MAIVTKQINNTYAPLQLATGRIYNGTTIVNINALSNATHVDLNGALGYYFFNSTVNPSQSYYHLNTYEFMFANNRNLISVCNFNQNHVVNMGYAFNGCRNLQTVTDLPRFGIYGSTFTGCSSLTTIPEIPRTVSNLSYTFGYCTNLTNVTTLPNSLIEMTSTFSSCINLTNITIPNSVVSINHGLSHCGFTTTPVIPNSVVDATYAFSECSLLVNTSSITNSSLVNIFGIFSYCRNLVNPAPLPNTVKDMGFAYKDCTNLANFPSIPNGCEDISGFCANCPQLFSKISTLNIPSSVKVFDYMFSGMNTTGTTVPQACWDLWNRCPDPVKISIRGMFNYWTNLQTVSYLPPDIQDMGSTFVHCEKLTSVPKIPDSVVSLASTFMMCYSLVTSPALSNNIVNLAGTYESCNNLTSAPVIPASALDLRYTFRRCAKLTGNIFIYSENVEMMNACFYNTSLQKNVYIPFTYSNGEYTSTYNAAILEGYDTEGTIDNVYLKNLCILTIYPKPSDATVTLTASGYTQKGNSIGVPAGTSVSYTVARAGYPSKSGTMTVNKSENIVVFLECNPGDVLFESSTPGEYTLDIQVPGTYELLCVGAGGGCAGRLAVNSSAAGAGGGSGGYSIENLTITPSILPIVVGKVGSCPTDQGAGVSTGGNGGNSSISSLISAGGGGGGSVTVRNSAPTLVSGVAGTGLTLNGNSGQTAKVVDKYATKTVDGGASVYGGYGRGGAVEIYWGSKPSVKSAPTNGYVKVTFISSI